MAVSPEAHFRATAPLYMHRLMADLVIGFDDAAAVFGNLGHESRGLTALQEEAPAVKGSRGGYGWPQWTGSRRNAFEDWCWQVRANPASDEANYRFLLEELRGTHAGAVHKLKAAKTLAAKVKAFELAYEGAKVKAYASRNRWAAIALDAYAAAYGGKGAGVGAGTAEPAPAPPASLGGHGAPVLAPVSERPTPPATIRMVQQMLRDKGYTEVGRADGVLGTMTRAAIRAFRAEHDLPAGDGIDAALLEALAAASPRALSPARTEATAAEVRAQVPEARASFRTKVLAGVGAAGSMAAGAFRFVTDNVGRARDTVRPLLEAIGDVPQWLYLGLLGAGLLTIALIAHHAQKSADEAYRTGARR